MTLCHSTTIVKIYSAVVTFKVSNSWQDLVSRVPAQHETSPKLLRMQSGLIKTGSLCSTAQMFGPVLGQCGQDGQ